MFLILYYRDFIKKRILRVNGLVERIISVVKAWLTTQKKCGQGQKEEISSKSMFNIQLYQFRKRGLIMSFNFTKTVVFTVNEKMPFNIPYDEEEFEKFTHALLVDKNAEWLGGYLFNIKNIVSIKRV